MKTKKKRFEDASALAFDRLEAARHWTQDRARFAAQGMAYALCEDDMESLRLQLKDAIADEQVAKLIWESCEKQLRE